MTADRYLEIFERLQGGNLSDASHLCSVAVEVIGCTGVGIAVPSPAGRLTVFGASSSQARTLMEWEITLGEGPCTEAWRGETVVREPFLDSLSVTRWPLYTSAALDVGARAVFGLPLPIGAVQVGALLVVQDHAGELTAEQSSTGYLMASVAARAVLALQAGVPWGTLSQETEVSLSFDPVVQRSAGMVAVQGSFSLADALVTIQARSFALGTTSSALAHRIVAREIVYDGESGTWREVAKEPVVESE